MEIPTKHKGLLTNSTLLQWLSEFRQSYEMLNATRTDGNVCHLGPHKIDIDKFMSSLYHL